MSTIAILKEVQAFLDETHHHFINGQAVSTANTTFQDVFNPATGAKISQVAVATTDDVNKAVEVAHAAYKDQRWSSLRPADREKILYQLSVLVEQHAEILAQLETLNQGKSIHISRGVEVGGTVEYIRYIAGWTTKLTGETFDVSIPVPPGTKYTAYTKREAVGVVAAITPWNFPLAIACWKVIPALAAGCTVVLKPSPETPLTSLYLAKLAKLAGIPDGVFNVIVGAGAEAGQALVEHKLVRKISFTGSTLVGKKVGTAAVNHMAHFSLELGGKNPMIIMDDVATDKAIQGIMMGSFMNSGQVCAAASRIYIHQKKYDEIAAALVTAVKGLKVGAGLDETAQIQPLVSARQRKSVQHFIDQAKQEGNTILYGDQPVDQKGFYVSPTVIGHVKPDSTVVKEEIFGPVVVLIPFSDIDSVLAEVNDTDYGLAASLWTDSLDTTMRLLPQIEAGIVWVNVHVPLDPAMPFGGVKQSGLGRDFGKASVESYTELKTVCIAHT